MTLKTDERIRKAYGEPEFCVYCGAGIGKHRRFGEGTCYRCDPEGCAKARTAAPAVEEGASDYVRERLAHQAKFGLDTLCHTCAHDRHTGKCRQGLGYLSGKVCGCDAAEEGRRALDIARERDVLDKPWDFDGTAVEDAPRDLEALCNEWTRTGDFYEAQFEQSKDRYQAGMAAAYEDCSIGLRGVIPPGNQRRCEAGNAEAEDNSAPSQTPLTKLAGEDATPRTPTVCLDGVHQFSCAVCGVPLDEAPRTLRDDQKDELIRTAKTLCDTALDREWRERTLIDYVEDLIEIQPPATPRTPISDEETK